VSIGLAATAALIPRVRVLTHTVLIGRPRSVPRTIALPYTTFGPFPDRSGAGIIDTVTMVIRSITGDAVFGRCVERLSAGGGVLGVSGLWGSSAPMVCTALHRATGRAILYVTAHLDEADEILDDLETFFGQRAALLPAWETLPGEGSASGEIHGERLRLCAALLEAGVPMLVAPVQALMQPVPNLALLQANTLNLRVGERRDPDEVVDWLIAREFERLERVETPGDFARRGDIIDIFAPGREDPVRLEFFDDRLDAIREFDVSTQRSLRSLDVLSLAATPWHQRLDPHQATTLLSYLGDDTLIILDRPEDVQEVGRMFWNRLNRSDQLVEPDALLRSLAAFTQIHLSRLGAPVGSPHDVFHFPVQSLARFEGRTDEAVRELVAACDDHRVIVYCHNDGERSRLRELIVEHAGVMPPSVELLIGNVHRGFEWTPAKTIVVPHHEIGRASCRERV